MSPKVRLPLGSQGATKSIGKVLTFYKRGGKQKVRLYNKPLEPPTCAQLIQRTIIRLKVETWQALSYSEKAVWDLDAKALGDPWSGYTLFMSKYELPYIPSPVFVSAETDSEGTIISITFDKAMADPAGKHATFSFTENGAPRTFSLAALGDSTIISLTVSGNPIAYGAILLVSYIKCTVLATDNGILEDFTDQTVTNNVTSPVLADIMHFRAPGRYFSSDLCFGPVTTAQILGNYILAYPFYCGPSQSFDRIAIRVTTFKKRSLIRFGIYSNLENPYPGSPLIDSGEFDSGVVGVKESVIDWTSEDYKLYWLVILCSSTPTLRGISYSYALSSVIGQHYPPSTTGYYGYAVPQAYGSLPDPFPGPVGYSGYPPPSVFLRKTLI